MKTAEALRYAQERDLDLVEVAPDAKPPVCRVLDYSKYKYEQNQRQKAARKHQQQITIREIKFRPKIAQHDYDTKKGHVERFLKSRDKVKVTIMFRGREQAHPERGEMILNRLAEELEDVAIVEQRPIQDGRNMTMMLGPLRTQEAEGDDEHHAAPEGPSKKERRQQKLEARAAEPGSEAADRPPAVEPAPEADSEPEPEPAPAAEEAAPEPVQAEAKPAPAKKAAAKKPAAKRPAKAAAAAKDG
ncbi:MAG: translation initiation factor [Solirubrobacteraceae bacterium]|nr:translation initiation factor [Solirubrobacteraceae bacterium]